MSDPEQVRASLVSLHNLGVGLSIDDYGSGYSSLANLRSIPADELKIDGMFVTGLPENSTDQLIITATVGLARSLGLKVVGECVETQADADMLGSLGCDVAQGYHYTPPLPADEFVRWMIEVAPTLECESALPDPEMTKR